LKLFNLFVVLFVFFVGRGVWWVGLFFFVQNYVDFSPLTRNCVPLFGIMPFLTAPALPTPVEVPAWQPHFVNFRAALSWFFFVCPLFSNLFFPFPIPPDADLNNCTSTSLPSPRVLVYVLIVVFPSPVLSVEFPFFPSPRKNFSFSTPRRCHCHHFQ